MVFTIIAAVFIMGFFGVGPVLVGESCSSCSSETNTSVSKCDVDKVQDSMRLKKLPKELKVPIIAACTRSYIVLLLTTL